MHLSRPENNTETTSALHYNRDDVVSLSRVTLAAAGFTCFSRSAPDHHVVPGNNEDLMDRLTELEQLLNINPGLNPGLVPLEPGAAVTEENVNQAVAVFSSNLHLHGQYTDLVQTIEILQSEDFRKKIIQHADVFNYLIDRFEQICGYILHQDPCHRKVMTLVKIHLELVKFGEYSGTLYKCEHLSEISQTAASLRSFMGFKPTEEHVLLSKSMLDTATEPGKTPPDHHVMPDGTDKRLMNRLLGIKLLDETNVVPQKTATNYDHRLLVKHLTDMIGIINTLQYGEAPIDHAKVFKKLINRFAEICKRFHILAPFNPKVVPFVKIHLELAKFGRYSGTLRKCKHLSEIRQAAISLKSHMADASTVSPVADIP